MSSALARSNTRAVRGQTTYDPKSAKAPGPGSKYTAGSSKTVPTRNIGTVKGPPPTATSKVSLKVAGPSEEPRGVNIPTARKHRDDVYTNNDDTTAKPEPENFSQSKVKNVAIDYEEEEEDPYVGVYNSHRQVIRYCDTHENITRDEFVSWLDKISRGNPKIKESLDKDLNVDTYFPGGTLLHQIVRGGHQNIGQVNTRFQKRFVLLQYLLDTFPELYAVKDQERHSVLEETMMKYHTAKLKGVNPFANYFVTEFPMETARQLERDEEEPVQSQKSPAFQLIPMISNPDIEGCGGLGGLLPHLTEAVLREKDENNNTILHLAVKYQYACDEKPESQQLLKRHIQTLIKIHPSIIGAINNEKESPYLHRVNTVRNHMKTTGGGPYQSDVITDYLKDLCMHRPIEEAITLLYGPRFGSDNQISLNLQELSHGRGTITRQKLTRFLDRFRFESILQFVEIPRLNLAPEAKSSAPPERSTKVTRKSTALTDGVGREDCLFILNYLQEKRVRKIIELVVDDEQDPPHTDTVISSLNTFDIEVFDWVKIDLCSDTIFKAAPYAHKIYLYSSGNNAVLRSWSSVDGLARFTKLREVEVEVRQRVESTAATKEMIAIFKERMATNCPQVTTDKLVVHRKKYTEPSANTAGAGGNALAGTDFVSLNINAWMRTMENFATFIRNIPDNDTPAERRVKVAVIDDGIDAMYNEEQFATTLKGGESFSTGSRRPKPYFFSSTGHGTLMADLVQRVCPKVQLYVARLDELREPDGSVQPTPESAAKAIRWAIEQGVDVISMSWTVTSKYEHIIRSAIEEAAAKDILMFGAASDQGYNAATKVYPAEYDQVFCIGAAKATGRADAAAELQAQYVFPGGEWSDLRASRGPTDNPLDHAWGSSFSTALASGLAALILECSEILSTISPGKQYRGLIRKKDKLDAIFSGMIREKGSKYIPVTQYFTAEMASAAWDTEGKQKFKKTIKNLLRPILE